MIVLGLTGSIAMGKSETARMFQELGCPVFDSDATVHKLYDQGGEAVPVIAALYPDAVVDGKVDRQILAGHVLGDAAALKRLEEKVHPLVRQKQEIFLEQARSEGETLAILDIPLLFETGRQNEVDRIVVVSAPPDIQRKRALARPDMTAEKLKSILARQVPDGEKRHQADFIVDSSVSLEHAFEQVRQIVQKLQTEAQMT